MNKTAFCSVILVILLAITMIGWFETSTRLEYQAKILNDTTDYYLSFINKFVSNYKIECPKCICYPITCYERECQKSNIEQIAENLAKEKNYSDGYNCDEFSKELTRRYMEFDYEAYYCEGYYKNGTERFRHAWAKVSVPIETTYGYIIAPEDYKEYYVEDFCYRYYK